MQNLYLIAIVAGKRVAIEAQCVESVVKVGEVISVPHTDPVVAGLYALRSRVMTLIDCQYRITGATLGTLGQELAVIATVGVCQYGFLVEKVIDVATPACPTIQSLPQQIGVWSEFISGVIDMDGEPVMVMNIEKLVSRESHARAA
jgi:purine-binding chemotaxis protein CheW